MSLLKTTIVLSAILLPLSVAIAEDQETQQLHNNAYQQASGADCTSNEYCYVRFPPTTHVMTAITNVSCIVDTGPATSIFTAAIISDLSASNPAAFALQPFYSGIHDSTVNFGINSATNLFVAKGMRPVFMIYMTGSSPSTGVHCTISGYHS